MPDTKASALPNAETLTGAEKIYGVQSGASVNITPNQLKTLIGFTSVFTGGNAIANGLCETGNNFNFSNFNIDQIYVPPGASKSFKLPTASTFQTVQLNDTIFAADTQALLKLTLTLLSGNASGGNHNNAMIHYIYAATFDGDNLPIGDVHVVKFPGSAQTSLAVALNPGNTTITLASATGWQNGGPVYQRGLQYWQWNAGLGIYCYQEASGRVHAPYTYTRAVAPGVSTGIWLAGGISGNVITLNPAIYPSGWTGPALQIGTPMQNNGGGGALNYFFGAAAFTLPAGRTDISKTFTINQLISGADLYLYPGTSKIAIGMLFNYTSGTGSEMRVANVVVRYA